MAPKQDKSVPLHKVQAIGSHNSYHLKPSDDINNRLQTLIKSGVVSGNNEELTELFGSVRYSHPPIDEQLETLKVRSIELDCWPDPDGGRFKCNAVRRFFWLGNYTDRDPGMTKPGFKVFHQDGIDQESTCKTLEGCLQLIKQWSDANPSHFPIFLRLDAKHTTTIEVIEKASPIAARIFRWGLAVSPGLCRCGHNWPTVPSPMPVDTVKDLLDTYVTVLGEDKIVKPDDLRGSYPSLQAALQGKGADAFWPDVDSVRGKFFIIPGGINKQLRELYGKALAGSPAFTRLFITPNTLASRAPASDQVFIEHDAKALGPAFSPLKRRGLFAVARVDTALVVDKAPQLYAAAVEAGANLIVSDFIVPQEFDDTNYTVKLPCDEAEFCTLP